MLPFKTIVAPIQHRQVAAFTKKDSARVQNTKQHFLLKTKTLLLLTGKTLNKPVLVKQQDTAHAQKQDSAGAQKPDIALVQKGEIAFVRSHNIAVVQDRDVALVQKQPLVQT